MRNRQVSSEYQAAISKNELETANKVAELEALKDNMDEEIALRTREREQVMEEKSLEIEKQRAELQERAKLEMEEERLEFDKKKDALKKEQAEWKNEIEVAKLNQCEHEFFEEIKEGMQFCKKCGRAIAVSEFCRQHSWKDKESYTWSNTNAAGKRSVTAHSYVQRCMNCGEFRTKKVDI